MISDEETHNIKVVDLEKLRNFVVHNFFIWIHLRLEYVFEFLKFEIQILQMTSDQKTYNIKVVDLEKLWNFVVQIFFYLNSFRASNK